MSTRSKGSSEVKRDSPLGAPSNVYLGIFDEAEQVRAVLKDLGRLEVARDGLVVFAGHEDEAAFEEAPMERLDSSLGGATLVRKLFAADEVEKEKFYHDALERGDYVLQVQVDEDDEALREQVEAALLGAGGHYIHYFGRLTFENVIADKEP